MLSKILATIREFFGVASKVQDIQELDSNEILYTTPTLNDSLPQETLPKADESTDCALIHEDDWRQFEYVELIYHAQIEQELQSIDEIWEKYSVPIDEYSGFKKVHIRKLIPHPIDIEFTLDDFEKLLGSESLPFSFSDSTGYVRGIRAVKLGESVVYAEIRAGRLRSLGFDIVGRPNFPPEIIKSLVEFANANQLQLIHWRSRTRFESSSSTYTYFSGE